MKGADRLFRLGIIKETGRKRNRKERLSTALWNAAANLSAVN